MVDSRFPGDSGYEAVFQHALDEVVADDEFSEYSSEAPALREQVLAQPQQAMYEGAARAGQQANQQVVSYESEIQVLQRASKRTSWAQGGTGFVVLVGGAAVPLTWTSGNAPAVLVVVLPALVATVLFSIRFIRLRSELRSLRQMRDSAKRIEDLVVRDSLRSSASGAYSSLISSRFAEEGATTFPKRAPRLVELELDTIVPLASIARVTQFIEDHETSAIGITGPRGAGKSTLLAAVCESVRNSNGAAVLIPSPVEHDPMDLLRSVAFGLRGEQVDATRHDARISAERRIMRRRRTLLLGLGCVLGLALGLILIGVTPAAGATLIDFITTYWLAVAGVALAVASIGLIIRYRPRTHYFEAPDLASVRTLDDVIETLSFEVAAGGSMTAGVTGGPIEVGAERTHSKTSRDVSHSQLSTALRNALRSLGAETEGPFLLAIDELDKLPNREALLKTVNAFKDLLHLRNVHVAMTLSDEALGAFELRQTTERDAFDSTFDTIIDMERLDQAAAIDVVDSRVPGFPRSLTLLCFVWAGGLPRDLLRHARTCMDYVRDLDPQPTWQDVSFSVARSEAARKMGAAVRAGSPAIGNLTIRTLTETWSSRPPTAQDLEPIEGLDESSARLCAYAALCFATIWVVLRAEGASPETARVLTLLRDGVVATALVGSLETAGKLLTMLNEGGHFAGPEPQTDADYGTEDAQVRRGPLDSSIWWS